MLGGVYISAAGQANFSHVVNRAASCPASVVRSATNGYSTTCGTAPFPAELRIVDKDFEVTFSGGVWTAKRKWVNGASARELNNHVASYRISDDVRVAFET